MTAEEIDGLKRALNEQAARADYREQEVRELWQLLDDIDTPCRTTWLGSTTDPRLGDEAGCLSVSGHGDS